MALLDEYPDTKATKYYLQVIKSILDSYLNRDLDPISHITEAWFALVFVRYWHQWLLCHKHYTLKKNFTTLNSYICIELNAHTLITTLLVLRDKLSETGLNSYLPWMFGSQRAFRLVRSMTPMVSTMINFNLLGLLRRLHKL